MCTCMPDAEYYAMKNNGQQLPVFVLCYCCVLFLGFSTEYLVHFSALSFRYCNICSGLRS